jgi:hypothetical protein
MKKKCKCKCRKNDDDEEEINVTAETSYKSTVTHKVTKYNNNVTKSFVVTSSRDIICSCGLIKITNLNRSACEIFSR